MALVRFWTRFPAKRVSVCGIQDDAGPRTAQTGVAGSPASRGRPSIARGPEILTQAPHWAREWAQVVAGPGLFSRCDRGGVRRGACAERRAPAELFARRGCAIACRSAREAKPGLTMRGNKHRCGLARRRLAHPRGSITGRAACTLCAMVQSVSPDDARQALRSQTVAAATTPVRSHAAIGPDALNLSITPHPASLPTKWRWEGRSRSGPGTPHHYVVTVRTCLSLCAVILIYVSSHRDIKTRRGPGPAPSHATHCR